MYGAWDKQADLTKARDKQSDVRLEQQSDVRPEQVYVTLAIISLRVKSRYTNMPVLQTNVQGQITPTVITTLLTHQLS